MHNFSRARLLLESRVIAAMGNDRQQKGKGKGAWGKGGKGKGMYYMEDDWSAGQSGYSFDVPLFLNSLAQDAAGEWQVAKSKNSTKPVAVTGKGSLRCGATGTGACTTCPVLH